jgi:hypothetical protein
LEIGLQVFYFVAAGGQSLLSRTAIPIFTPNEYCGFFNKPNLSYLHRTNEFKCLIYTNSQGFRVARPGVEYSRYKAPDTFRVMLVGPSFTFGWGVNYGDTVAARLEEMLKPCLGGKSRIEIINTGVPSMAPLPQLNWLTHVGCSFMPDLIVQFIYGSMSIDPDGNHDLFADRQGFLEQSDLSTREWVFDEAKKSAMVFYGWMLYTTLFPGRGQRINGAGRGLERAARFRPDAAEVKVSLDYYRRLLRAADECGAKLTIVYLPLSYCVHRGDLARWRHLGVEDNIDEQIAFDREFCDYLDQAGEDCLNITPDLVKSAAEPGRLYYWLDIHWTPRGNLVAARAIEKHLAQRFMDDCRPTSR